MPALYEERKIIPNPKRIKIDVKEEALQKKLSENNQRKGQREDWNIPSGLSGWLRRKFEEGN